MYASDQFHSSAQRGAFFAGAAGTACGRRPSNEDQHLLLCDWGFEGSPAGLFAVFDGHGGPAVAMLASWLLPRALGMELESAGPGRDARREAIERAFLKLDARLASKEVAVECGSTCVAAVVLPEGEGDNDGRLFRVLLANLGDSRGLLVRIGCGTVFEETVDHKPSDPAERRRIVKAGGVVMSGIVGPDRIDGDISVSRAFGDFRLKDNKGLPPEQQRVSPLPDVYESLCQVGDLIVLVCDGAIDVLSSSEIGLLATAAIAADGDVRAACAAVVREALDRGSGDNVTCVVAQVTGQSSKTRRCTGRLQDDPCLESTCRRGFSGIEFGDSWAGMESPGDYVITSDASVKDGLRLDSNIVDSLTVGMVVTVVEVYPLPGEHRIRGRIVEPPGFITLRDTLGGYVWGYRLDKRR